MSLGFRVARWFFNAFNDNRQEFYEDFASALRDGASANERLKKMALRARQRRNGSGPLFDHWLRKMRRMSFAHALQHTVPEYEVMVLTAAEEDGRLHEAMEYLGRALRLSSKIKGAYFMSLVSPVIALVTLLSFFLVYALIIGPQNLEALPWEKWPEISKLIYQFSNALVENGFLFITGCVIWAWLVLWSRKNWHGSIRGWVDRIPMLPWSGYKEREANNFLVSLAILLQSNNHGPKEALERMRKFSSPWLSGHIVMMLKRLKLSPDQPARALNTGLFPRRVMDRIEDYSERTDFTRALRMLAFDQGDKQVQQAERRAIFSGYFAMVIVALVIGLIVMANYEFNQALEVFIQNIR